MRTLESTLRRVAQSDFPVLLYGESGTGKDLFAQLIHFWSSFAEGPYVKVNCAAIPGQLLESELFGFEKGAFTGAYASKQGRFELATDGTLFLDEIAEMDFDVQAKLLHVLQDGQFNRIGAHQDMQARVRVVCATNRDLEEEVELGRFRHDLMYRIAVMAVRVPSLRERSEDIPEIAAYLLARYAERYNSPQRPLTPAIIQQLQRHSWPGNIRELENVMRRYAVLGTADALMTGLEKGPKGFSPDDFIIGDDCSLKKVTRRAVAHIERQLILRVLQAYNWNRTKAAKQLRISYRALLYKMKQADLPSSRRAASAQLIKPQDAVPAEISGERE